ncbi:hypothetical protein MOQ_006167 [Trypanosoma cruzi marinkellei]|uniref:Uncharacterized protein n=1 Tax=Trypanosoma cruzi marinkellei TaxID=85056 RepID=K2M555_TRYCR|nr:hypothetical protein MOQ_006167 [Trypanosoma cruzi marinkellei]
MSSVKPEKDQSSDYGKTKMWLIIGCTLGTVVLVLITVFVILIVNFIKRRIALAKEVKQRMRMQNARHVPVRSSLIKNVNRNGPQTQSSVNDDESPPPEDTAKWPGVSHPNVLSPQAYNDASYQVSPSVPGGTGTNKQVPRPRQPETQDDHFLDLPSESISADYVDPLLWHTEDLDGNIAAASQMNGDDDRRPSMKHRASFVSFVGEYKL